MEKKSNKKRLFFITDNCSGRHWVVMARSAEEAENLLDAGVLSYDLEEYDLETTEFSEHENIVEITCSTKVESC